MAEASANAAQEPVSEAPTATPCHLVQDDWTTLPRDVLIDKIKGAIYGQAIGDAIGLATEFLDKAQARKYYGKNGPTGYKKIVQDFHRSRWDAGDWTDDTDQMLLILLSIIDNNGALEKTDFARRMQGWMLKGFPELGDVGGMGIGMTTSRVLRHERFLVDPHAVAKEVWEQSGKYLAANGALMRTSILGVLSFNDLEKVKKNTMDICNVTHADPRCSASCVAVTSAIALMLQGKYNPQNKHELSSLVDEAVKLGEEALFHEDQKKEMRTHVLASSLEKLHLDEQKSIGYTFKCLGAGFWGLRNGTDFRKAIIKLIMEAGDADSNGAVCGALMGCKLGFKALPRDLLEFPHRQWLDDKVQQFLATIGLL